MSKDQDPPVETVTPEQQAQLDAETARELTTYNLRKARLDVQKLKMEIQEFPRESFRKWSTLAAIIAGVIITLVATVAKIMEAPPAPKGVANECSSPR